VATDERPAGKTGKYAHIQSKVVSFRTSYQESSARYSEEMHVSSDELK